MSLNDCCTNRFWISAPLSCITKAMLNKIGRFSKQDIRELYPALSVSSIEGALRKLVASGELKREGNGKKPATIV